MEPEKLSPDQVQEPVLDSQPTETQAPAFLTAESPKRHYFSSIFLNSDCELRSGWSVLLFLLLSALFMFALGSGASLIAKHILHHKPDGFSAVSALISEIISVLAILAAGSLVARFEHRHLLDYNLTGPRRLWNFGGGLAAGFVALSALVGAMTLGGWMHFGPVALSGSQILVYAGLWGAAFLLTGFFEEGSFRCYLQYTLTRGLNFWWALGINASVCLFMLIAMKGSGVWGVYGFALLGLLPCLILHVKKVPTAPFWQAAWVTSMLFGFIHTSNNGENWIGIFAAAAIGFVFCVSIRLTGSAWWAIGCHAAWDWAETYFYGTSDSGFVASGHFLSSTTSGNALWSGGTDGPEGSLLVLPIILLLLVALLVIYARKKRIEPLTIPIPAVD
jgi:hypothetical protein